MAFSISPPSSAAFLEHSHLASARQLLNQFSQPSEVYPSTSFNLKYISIVRTRKLLTSCNSNSHNSSSLDSKRTHFEKHVINSEVLTNQRVIDVFLANKLILEYIKNRFFEDAVQVYVDLLSHGQPIQELTCFPSLIKAFGELSELNLGKQIHGHVLKLGNVNDIYVLNSLLGMYSKCGAVKDGASCLFDKMPQRDSVSWNTMISGFNQSMQHWESLVMFRRMVLEFRVSPNHVACISALSSCGSIGCLIHGREIHAFVVRNGLDIEPILVNGLVVMYTKCRHLRNAELVFEQGLNIESLRENTAIWNAMISGYVKDEHLYEALMLFQKMLVLGVQPDYSTMVAALVLCSQLRDLRLGRRIHGYIVSFGLENDTRVATALLDMYCKCGDIDAGLRVFERSSSRNSVMWGVIISGCSKNGYLTRAFDLFAQFRSEGGVPDSGTILAILRVCSSLTLGLEGMLIHSLSLRLGFDSDIFVGGALTDMYSKFGDIESAEKMFFSLPRRDIVSWNALISGYTKSNCVDKAFNALRDLQVENVKPNTVTVSHILTICAQLSLWALCKQIHAYIMRNSFETNTLVMNSLIAAYAKCGDINSAWCIFNSMPERNDISWNSMILGFGIHGQMDDMSSLFDKMIASGVMPDHMTFTAILSGCSHTGRVDEGWKHFRRMVEEYKIKPELKQYTCMVDLLGRAGNLEEAYNLIVDMPSKPDARIWGSLLGSCKIHGNKQMAERVANHIFELDSESVGYHVLLSNIYEDFGDWDDATRVRETMKDLALQKSPGSSWIEVDGKTHVFVASDRSHCESEELYSLLGLLTEEIKRAGYIPRLNLINVEGIS